MSRRPEGLSWDPRRLHNSRRQFRNPNELRQRQYRRHCPRHSQGHRRRQRGLRTRLWQRSDNARRRKTALGLFRARGRRLPGSNRHRREFAGAGACHAALDRRPLPRQCAHHDRRMRRAGVLRARHQADRSARRPRQAAARNHRRRDRALFRTLAAPGQCRVGLDHAGDRSRHDLSRGGDRSHRQGRRMRPA